MTAPLFPDLVVNGERVPHTAIAAEAQMHAAPADKPGLAWRKAANAVAIRTLLLQEAARRGLRADPQPVGEGRVETVEEALVRALLDRAVAVAEPTEGEVRAEWARDPSRFRAPPLWEASHILIACDPADPAARAAARARADALLAELGTAPAQFATLARDHSACSSAGSGGSLGQLRPGDTLPEFEAALRSLTPGALLPEPLLTRHGWHVLRLDAAAEGRTLPFDSVAPKLAEAMEKSRWARAARSFVQSLVDAARIEGLTVAPIVDGAADVG